MKDRTSHKDYSSKGLSRGLIGKLEKKLKKFSISQIGFAISLLVILLGAFGSWKIGAISRKAYWIENSSDLSIIEWRDGSLFRFYKLSPELGGQHFVIKGVHPLYQTYYQLNRGFISNTFAIFQPGDSLYECKLEEFTRLNNMSNNLR